MAKKQGGRMTEKSLALFLESILTLRMIPWIHIPNRIFRNYKFKGGRKIGSLRMIVESTRNFYTAGDLKNMADYIFPYGGCVHMIELGVPGRHLDRKAEQLAVMKHWASLGGVKYAILFSENCITEKLKEWGIIK